MDVEDFDVGGGINEALDRIKDLAQMSVGRGDDRYTNGGSLPLVLMVDLRHRNVETMAESVDDRTDCGALDLEGPAFGNMKIETHRGRMHSRHLRTDGVNDLGFMAGPNEPDQGVSTMTGISRSVFS